MRYDIDLLIRISQTPIKREYETLAEIVDHPDVDDEMVEIIRAIAHRWKRSGYPRLTTSHRRAAALMCTHVPQEVACEVKAPWGTYLIDVPGGLVESDRKSSNQQAIIHSVPSSILISVDDSVCTGIIFGNGPEHIIDALVADENASGLVPSIGGFLGEQENYRLMLGRYVVGMSAEATELHPSETSKTQSIKRDPRGNPVTWTFQVTRDVTVDCRQYVRDFCAGTSRSSPTVQSLVRGHMKRQPCGAGSAERKTIFVEPYWRGPEDSPIAVKSHRIMESR